MKVVLHGGGNFRSGLVRAERLGIRCVEADVMLCFHDGALEGALCVHPGSHLPERTSEGHLAYRIAEASDIVRAATSERPLLLEELLDELGARDMHAMIESKVAGTLARVEPLLARRPNSCTVLSFLGEELSRGGAFPRGCLLKHDPSPPVWRAMQDAYDLTVYAPEHWYLSPRTVELAHAHHVQVVPWDVDDPAKARELARMGADAVLSNEPEALLEAGACTTG